MSRQSHENDPVENARDDERRRIASELHDRVLQTLAAVALRLEAMRRRMLGTEAEAQSDLEFSGAGIRSSIREIRSVLAGGNDASSWEAGSLLERLRSELQSMERNGGIHVSMETEPANLVVRGAELEYGVFRATVEALRNIVLHANASGARLSVALNGDTLLVSLSDNGRGFDPGGKAGAGRKGAADRYGLQSMRSRIEGLGGSVTIRSGSGLGTNVSFRVPVVEPARICGKRTGGGDGMRGRGRRIFGKRPRLWLASAIVAGGFAALVFLFPLPGKGGSGKVRVDLLGSAVRHYEQVAIGAARPASNGSRFDLLDLRPWGYRILSKKTREVDGLESNTFIYQSDVTRSLLVAEEFAGVKWPLLGTGATIEVSGQEYATYSRTGIHSVAWNEDGTLCVLTSSMPKKDLLELARRMTRARLAVGRR